jgi:hypothetical protein
MVSFTPLPLYLREELSVRIGQEAVELYNQSVRHEESKTLDSTGPEQQLLFVGCAVRPPLWSSGQSSWLQIRRPGFDSRHYQKKK